MKKQMVIAIIVFAVGTWEAYGFSSEASKLAPSYNEFSAARGFGTTMFLSDVERSPESSSFTYFLNDCVGILGTAKDRKNLDEIIVNSSGCHSKEKAAGLVHLLLFLAAQCTASEKRPDSERMMLAAFNSISARDPARSVDLGTCKISMSLSDAVGFMAFVK